MSSGLRESRRFAKRQRRWRLFKRLFVLAVLVGLGVASYQTGTRLSEESMRQANREIVQLTNEKQALERENVELKAAADTARARYAELQKRYAADVPQGERKALMAQIDQQLKDGAAPDRLSFLIAAAGHKEKCDGQPLTKRFIVRTTLYEGANSVVTFADAALTVTASGEPAVDANGRPQAWFDPAKPVTIEIARLGEAPHSFTGVLPLRQAIVVNGSEYRMNFLAGETRGFINATADRCQFP